MIAKHWKRTFALVASAFAIATAADNAAATATITIVNVNAAGVGFNDTTPAAPVGGNTGTTLGQQRLNAFTFAASIWAQTLSSTVPIIIQAQFSALSCTATAATLGSAGATEVFRDFDGALVPGAWYSFALTNKLIGSNADPATPQINANFNANLGQPGCLTGTPFYLGLDANAGTAVDLVTVLLHEFGHGFGFQTFTNGQTGAFLAGFPSIWDFTLLDDASNLTWNQMTNAQRAASSINGKLVWTGAGVVAAVPSVLAAGTPELAVTAPAANIATYQVGAASFGPQLSPAAVQAEIIQVVDQTNGQGLACNPFTPAVAATLVGQIALVDRGTCNFNVKADNAQAAGAIAVIVADNVAGSPPAGLGGTGPEVTIPAVRVTLADGNTLKAQLANHGRGRTAGVIGKLDVNLAIRAGADAFNRPLMYAPNPFIAGSSVSHWDTSAFPNQLMEPNINSDLTHIVTVPTDLTFRLLQDIGW
jgi:hypothetical protein